MLQSVDLIDPVGNLFIVDIRFNFDESVSKAWCTINYIVQCLKNKEL